MCRKVATEHSMNQPNASAVTNISRLSPQGYPKILQQQQKQSPSTVYNEFIQHVEAQYMK